MRTLILIILAFFIGMYYNSVQGRHYIHYLKTQYCSSFQRISSHN